jgi:hypothetical protein
MGFFEAINMVGVTMLALLKDLLSPYIFFNKLIAYVKYEGDNEFMFAQAFNSMVTCIPLGLVAL